MTQNDNLPPRSSKYVASKSIALASLWLNNYISYITAYIFILFTYISIIRVICFKISVSFSTYFDPCRRRRALQIELLIGRTKNAAQENGIEKILKVFCFISLHFNRALIIIFPLCRNITLLCIKSFVLLFLRSLRECTLRA